MKGQVETGFGEGAEAAQFGVDDPRLKQRKAFIRGDGVHLGAKGSDDQEVTKSDILYILVEPPHKEETETLGTTNKLFL